MVSPTDIDLARSLLASARRILVLTGAGISAESGVPTFRGPDGLWRNFSPEELATPEAFARDPRLVWEWYGWRRQLVGACKPNAGHLALARWLLVRDGITLVTQNVDGLHEAAAQLIGGAAGGAAFPVRLHGSIERVRCTRCHYTGVDRGVIDATSNATLPHCPNCAALLRPDVVWFGESLPESALELASRAALSAEVCLVVGTAGAVYPAAGFARTVYQRGGRVVVVDPGRTAFDDVAAIRLTGEAGVVLPEILG